LKAFVPALYPDSGSHPNDLVRLGRMTDWRQRGEELYMGAGQRLFAVDGEEKPLLDLREVEFTTPAGEEPSAPAAETDSGPRAA
jgi:type VI secretion system protein ImpE